ncbi:MAG: GPW/gp25 family protein [Ferruginibacter sp.]|nr:GPW/gp25 family protein [Ferruginibacter sp.]
MENRKQTFLGTGWNFPPTFHREFYGVEMIADEIDIKSSLDILLSTVTGERIMQPRYGCNLEPFIFEPLNTATKTMVEKIIKDAVTLNEPRILDPVFTIDYDDNEGKIKIDIEFGIITTNTRYNYVYPFYQTEATNLAR